MRRGPVLPTGSAFRRAALAAGALCATVAPFASASEYRNPRGVAVIVANSDYEHRDVSKVAYAGRDAEAFRRYVVDVLGFDPKNVVYTADATRRRMFDLLGTRRDPTDSELWSYLDDHEGSDVVVFYSGHGVPGTRDKRGYLLPVDADPKAAEDDGYPIDLLYENLGKLSEARSARSVREPWARSVRVFLDTCFSGGSHAGGLIGAASPVYVAAALPKNFSDKIVSLTAATGKQIASWDEKARHGLFTHHLLDALYGGGDADGDGRVTASEAKRYLDNRMTRAARRQHRRVQNASLAGASDAVLAAAPAGGFPARPALDTHTGEAVAPPPELLGDAAARAYEAAERVGTVAAFRVVKTRFPGSFEAELAQAQIDKLEGKPKPITVAGGDPEDDVAPAAPPPETVEQGLALSREERRLVQRGLAAAGYDPGPTDGMIGRGTREAIRRWQGARGEVETGYLDADGAKALLTMGATTMLTVRTVPPDARIRVSTTTGATYRDGMRLPPGQYEVSVEAKDHEPFRQHLAVDGPTSYRISLCKLEMRTEQICEDKQVERNRTERKTTIVDVEEDASVEVSEYLDEKGRDEDRYERLAESRSSLRRFMKDALCLRAARKLRRIVNGGERERIVPTGGSKYMRSECESDGGKFLKRSLRWIDGDYDSDKKGNDCSCDDLFYAFDECTLTVTWQCEVTKNVQVPYSVTEKVCRDETRPQRNCPPKIVTRLQ